MSLKLVIERELVSPNRWNGRHWRVKHRISQEWEREIWAVSVNAPDANLGILNKRRVMVTRVVPSRRNFIRDDDNLRFSVKPLLDALKRLRLILDDSRKWIELPTPAQSVSEDGQHYTVIEISAAHGSSSAVSAVAGTVE